MDSNRVDIGVATREAFVDELNNALDKVVHCVNQLSDDQVWWRPEPSMNSIANLMLHQCGNLGQWILAGVGGADDRRDRPREFAERGPISKSDLIRQLQDAVAKANDAALHASDSELVRIRRIQGFEVTGIAAILHAVAHFRGHTQEIIHMTRIQLGDHYRFYFVPLTPEQGAG